MGIRVTGAATSSLLVLLFAASVHAQAPSSARSEVQSPLSEMAHGVSTWLNRVTGATTNRQRTASSPPLPRPRPPELAPAPPAPASDSIND